LQGKPPRCHEFRQNEVPEFVPFLLKNQEILKFSQPTSAGIVVAQQKTPGIAVGGL
jgi:hypothetical protein